MPQTEYNSPGVYGLEVAPTRAQEGISPAKMGIIGWTERGRVNTPIEVRSVNEFTSLFGPINSNGLVAISMRAFFGTGGQRAWVVRVVPADAVEATTTIDTNKWYFNANGAGDWGNDLVIRVEGNRNFLDRTAGAEAWTKFDLKVLQPTDFDPDILGAAETFEAIQFTDSLASDYVVAVMTDPRNPSTLVDIIAGVGGNPSALLGSSITDEIIGVGDAIATARFIGNLSSVPLLDGTLSIVAADTQIDDEDQTATGSSSGPNTLFTDGGAGGTHDLATTPLTLALPALPGTVQISVNIGAGAVVQTDDGAGAFPVTAELPAGGTINYNTGALTGVTASLQAASSITETHTQSGTNPIVDGSATGFTFDLPSAPALDGSVRLFYAKTPNVLSEDVTSVVSGLIDGANQDYVIPATSLSGMVHKENTVFKIRYADPVRPPATSWTVPAPVGPALFDIALPGPNGPLLAGPVLPIHPGNVEITGDTGAGPVLFARDQGPGGVPVVNGNIGDIWDWGPAGAAPVAKIAEINYTTGIITGPGGIPVALTNTPLIAGPVIWDENVSDIITKAAVAGGDNMELGTALVGDVDGAGTNTIDHVNSLTNPTANGVVDFRTAAAPRASSFMFVDFVELGVVNSDLAGNLSGDVGIGTNTVDFATGAVDVEFDVAPANGTTIDADYATGQFATDDGLGNLIGDVDAAGNNTIDYATGAYDITWDTAPPDGTNILANYTKLARSVDFAFSGGANGTAITRAEITDPALETSREGIYAFDDVEDPINLVVPDFEGSLYVQADIVDYCEARNTRFAILGFANGTTKDEAIRYVLVDQAFDTKVAAIYWPNIYFVNELTNRVELMPVTPFIAGVYAKTANQKNVGKSPGGIDDGALDANGTIGPEYGDLINDIRVRDDLYQSRINPLFNSDATGFVVWGVRSLSTEFRWRYVNARTLHNYLMDAIARLLQWAVFENNGPSLWLKIESGVRGYMASLFKQGYFAGVREEQAFFVVCNATNNNQGTVDEGKVIIDIGFSPFKPAEFVIFRLSQPASTVTV